MALETIREPPEHEDEYDGGERFDRDLSECEVGGSVDDEQGRHRVPGGTEKQCGRESPANGGGTEGNEDEDGSDWDVAEFTEVGPTGPIPFPQQCCCRENRRS